MLGSRQLPQNDDFSALPDFSVLPDGTKFRWDHVLMKDGTKRAIGEKLAPYTTDDIDDVVGEFIT